jgi:hypothetical protein
VVLALAPGGLCGATVGVARGLVAGDTEGFLVLELKAPALLVLRAHFGYRPTSPASSGRSSFTLLLGDVFFIDSSGHGPQLDDQTLLLIRPLSRRGLFSLTCRLTTDACCTRLLEAHDPGCPASAEPLLRRAAQLRLGQPDLARVDVRELTV